MTRETKVGLVVAGSFVCLVAIVVATKFHSADASQTPSEVAEADGAKFVADKDGSVKKKEPPAGRTDNAASGSAAKQVAPMEIKTGATPANPVVPTTELSSAGVTLPAPPPPSQAVVHDRTIQELHTQVALSMAAPGGNDLVPPPAPAGSSGPQAPLPPPIGAPPAPQPPAVNFPIAPPTPPGQVEGPAGTNPIPPANTAGAPNPLTPSPPIPESPPPTPLGGVAPMPPVPTPSQPQPPAPGGLAPAPPVPSPGQPEPPAPSGLAPAPPVPTSGQPDPPSPSGLAPTPPVPTPAQPQPAPPSGLAPTPPAPTPEPAQPKPPTGSLPPSPPLREPAPSVPAPEVVPAGPSPIGSPPCLGNSPIGPMAPSPGQTTGNSPAPIGTPPSPPPIPPEIMAPNLAPPVAPIGSGTPPPPPPLISPGSKPAVVAPIGQIPTDANASTTTGRTSSGANSAPPPLPVGAIQPPLGANAGQSVSSGISDFGMPEVHKSDIPTHICQADEMDFTSICRNVYNDRDGKYALALKQFNEQMPGKPQPLPGHTVFVPKTKFLEQEFASAIAKGVPPLGMQVASTSGNTIPAGGFPRESERQATQEYVAPMGSRAAQVPIVDVNRDPGPSPMGKTELRPQAPSTAALPGNADGSKSYRVPEKGEHIRDIASRTLRDSGRWPEIYRLNSNLDPAYPIPGGTVLRLPPSAELSNP